MFIQFKIMAEKQFNTSIKIVHSDSGGEYQAFNSFLKQNGILHYLACPYTSKQNSRAERKHRHITKMGLTILTQAKMPLTFWWEAFHTATYLINRLPTPILSQKTPFKILFKKQPDYKFLHPFGCAAYPCLTPYNSQKLQFHSTKCLSVGYSDNHKGYTCISWQGIYFSKCYFWSWWFSLSILYCFKSHSLEFHCFYFLITTLHSSKCRHRIS